MSWLFQHLLGVLRPIAPHHWRGAILAMARSEGWVPPMMIIAGAVVLLLAVIPGFGLFGAHPAVQVFNYLALATWFLIATTATVIVLWQALRNVRRFGTFASGRPRWWFELSRITWIIALFSTLSLPLLHFGAAGRLARVERALFFCVPVFFGMFLSMGALGYTTAMVTGRPKRGRAFECVDYFYLQSIAGSVACAILFALLLGGMKRPATIMVCVSAVAILGSLALKIRERTSRKDSQAV